MWLQAVYKQEKVLKIWTYNCFLCSKYYMVCPFWKIIICVKVISFVATVVKVWSKNKFLILTKKNTLPTELNNNKFSISEIEVLLSFVIQDQVVVVTRPGFIAHGRDWQDLMQVIQSHELKYFDWKPIDNQNVQLKWRK